MSMLGSCWNVCVSVHRKQTFASGMVEVLGVGKGFCLVRVKYQRNLRCGRTLTLSVTSLE